MLRIREKSLELFQNLALNVAREARKVPLKAWC
jgi:hypothetical protein